MTTFFRFPICLTIIIAMISSVGTHAAPDPQAYAALIDKFVAKVDAKNGEDLNKSLLTGTDRGGTLAIRRNNGEVSRIELVIGLSNRGIEKRFYFDNGELVLARIARYFYTWDDGRQELDPTRRIGLVQETFYFRKLECVLWIVKHFSPADEGQDALVSAKQKELLKQAQFFLDAARGGKDGLDVEQVLKNSEL